MAVNFGSLMDRAKAKAGEQTSPALPDKRPVIESRPQEQSVKPPWSDISESTRWVVLELRILDNEQILFVFEKKHLREARKAHPDKVIYFPPEMRELYQFKDKKESFQKVHLMKKKFKGWIVPSATKTKGGGKKSESKKKFRKRIKS